MNPLQSSLLGWYKDIKWLVTLLSGITDRVDFERIRPIPSDLYENYMDKGGIDNTMDRAVSNN